MIRTFSKTERNDIADARRKDGKEEEDIYRGVVGTFGESKKQIEQNINHFRKRGNNQKE